jgi:hypothetical protein
VRSLRKGGSEDRQEEGAEEPVSVNRLDQAIQPHTSPTGYFLTEMGKRSSSGESWWTSLAPSHPISQQQQDKLTLGTAGMPKDTLLPWHSHGSLEPSHGKRAH